jgi:hypothetical protein
MQDDSKSVSGEPYRDELRHLGERLALLDEEAARALLEDIEDVAEALISEQQSRGKPSISLTDLRRSLGLDR